MTPDLRTALRTVAEALPPGAAVPVPREQLLELLDGIGPAGPAPAPSPADRLLTVEDAAQRCALSARYVYAHADRLPFVVRVGRKVRISEAKLARWLERPR